MFFCAAAFVSKSLAFFSGEGMNHLHCYWDKCSSPLLKLLFSTVVLNGFLSLMKGSSLLNPSSPLLPFFGLGVTNDATKPNCVLLIGDDGSSNGCRSSSMLIIEINEAQLKSKLKLCQNVNTGNYILISCTQFLRIFFIGFLYFRETTR